MAEEAEFRFLSDEEFLKLTVLQRATYLSRASHELEVRQQMIRDQLNVLKKDVGKA